MNYTKAKIIKDTYHPLVPSARITTFEVHAPRFMLAEVNTHGLIAKSAQSSRAIPVAKRIQMVREEPFVPLSFGKNQKGMQSTTEVDNVAVAESIWNDAIQSALEHAEALMGAEVHKQFANRVLEPFAYYDGVLTATEWDWFFLLRNHKDAQPEFRDLAEKMEELHKESKPEPSRLHLPYYDEDVSHLTEVRDFETIKQCTITSAARCARVSYRTFDTGLPSTLEVDEELGEKLLRVRHMSPFDHVGIADEFKPVDGLDDLYQWQNWPSHGRFWGWTPVREFLQEKLGLKPARLSHEPFKIE
jgi:thymidylate synthase ThyX